MRHTRNYRQIGMLSVLSLVLVVSVVLILAVCQTAPIQGQAPEVPTMVPGIAEEIRSGVIDVGDVYTIDRESARFHTIHAETLELDCEICHMEQEMTEEQSMFDGQRVPFTAEGPVAREVCLACHQGGEATDLYGPVE